MADRIEIRFAGSGGQGVVTAGAILGEAASRGGLRAASSSSYGSQARGGVTKSDVVIVGEGFIDFPHVTRPDVLAVMNDESYRAYLPSVAASGVVLVDPYGVKRDAADARIHHEVLATAEAIRTLGKVQAANVIMLGAVVGLTGLVPLEPVIEALAEAFGAHALDVNERALRIGHEAGLALAREAG